MEGSIQDLIFLLKIPMGTRKILFEIYGQFGHAPSIIFARTALVYSGPFKSKVCDSS
jgi:hypothetical protein